MSSSHVPFSLAMPTNGNAGAAWSMYAARAGMQSLIVMPVDAPEITRRECVAAGLEESMLVEGTHMIAFGINVPKALGDFLVLQAVRDTGGTAVAVTDEEILAEVTTLATAEGTWTCPEGAACTVAAKQLRVGGWIGEDERWRCSTPGRG